MSEEAMAVLEQNATTIWKEEAADDEYRAFARAAMSTEQETPPEIVFTAKKTAKGRRIVLIDGQRYVESPLAPVPDRREYLKAYRRDKKVQIKTRKEQLAQREARISAGLQERHVDLKTLEDNLRTTSGGILKFNH